MPLKHLSSFFNAKFCSPAAISFCPIFALLSIKLCYDEDEAELRPFRIMKVSSFHLNSKLTSQCSFVKRVEWNQLFFRERNLFSLFSRKNLRFFMFYCLANNSWEKLNNFTKKGWLMIASTLHWKNITMHSSYLEYFFICLQSKKS